MTPVKYAASVTRALNSRNRRWYSTGTYRNAGTAQTIAYIIRTGKGLKAFEGHAGKFETRFVKNEDGTTTVQFRKI